jgi:virginiamycin B lyase
MTTARGGRALLAIALTVAALGIGAASPPPAAATTGAITLFGGSTANLFPSGGIALAGDGNLYFTNPMSSAPHALGRVTPAGVVTLLPDAGMTQAPNDVTAVGSHEIWFTVTTANLIGRYDTTSHVFTYFPSGNIFPFKITTAADGSVWYTAGGGAAQRMHTGAPGRPARWARRHRASAPSATSSAAPTTRSGSPSRTAGPRGPHTRCSR